MSTLKFAKTGGGEIEVAVKRTTPNAVDAYQAEWDKHTTEESKDYDPEMSTMALLFAMLPFVVSPVNPSDDLKDLDYGEFDIEFAREATNDFLPNGVEIVRTLTGS